jgi:N-methylhydantoinase A
MLLGVDTGGTFTDFVLFDGAALRLHKVLSTPDDPSRAIERGIAELGLRGAVAAGHIMLIHGSTVATNAALENKGVRTAYITNRGFTDVLRIGRQARTGLYSLTPQAHADPVPAELLLGTGGRIAPDGTVIEPLTDADISSLRTQILALAPAAIAINLLYSYVDDTGERTIEAALQDLAFISRSSFVLPEYKEYERGMATWLNAWLGPVVERYLVQLARSVAPSQVCVMQSSGGVISVAAASRRAVNLLLSGPAGGLAAAGHLGRTIDERDLLTFDMGGTSTDVALIQGSPALTGEGRIGPYPVAIPMADIHTIGAGGGSIAYLDAAGALHVGPQSAGAAPGPACYGLGGVEPTVTDANVVLGRIAGAQRLGGTLPLHPELAERALRRIAEPLGLSVESAASGVVAIANQHMVQALRVISLERGHDPRQFTLVSFGGAGGLHVCALSHALQIPRIVVPQRGGVFSALGMLVADRSRQLIKTINADLDDLPPHELARLFDALARPGRRELQHEGAAEADIVERRFADLRYRGQSFTLTVPWTSSSESARAFHERHASRYGHAFTLPVELVNIRCELSVPAAPLELPQLPHGPPGAVLDRVRAVGYDAVCVYERQSLAAGQTIDDGPALIIEDMTTTFIEPGWSVLVDAWGNLRMTARTPRR